MHEQFYKSLYRIRRVEEELARNYPTDKIKSPVHLSIGQEAVSVAVCQTLEPDDVVFGTYRGHAMYLAKGGNLKAMVAEMYGKASGCTKGKGGSMHLIDTAAGVMGTSAVVGTTIANAVGCAYAMKLRGSRGVVASFFGDGASEEGVFYESLNFAVLKKLPVLFVCENNGYAIHTHQTLRQGVAKIHERAKSFGMSAQLVENNDCLALHEHVSTAVKALRGGTATGPFFFECRTSRWREHVGPNEDFHLGYRTKQDLQPWVDNDQVVRIAKLLAPAKRAQIEAAVEAEVQEAFAFADASPFPDESELYTDVFHNQVPAPLLKKVA
ncbi:MAG TPA: thiamine pyrophosphate-dependent dehydrogenase E1 component subunit alpha [Pirellulales bacterium]